MKGFKNKNGISLIVLVITIIVMIILAAAIILSLNNSEIMEKANKAKTESDIATIKEILAVYEAESVFNDERVTLDSIASKLEENGITTKKTAGTTQNVKNISLDKTNIDIALNATSEITVTIEQEEVTFEKLYAKISDEYYEIYRDNSGRLEISNDASEPDNQELKIDVTGAYYINVSINQDSKKIILTSGANVGTDILWIKYGGKVAPCIVNVKKLITFTINSEYDSLADSLSSGTFTAEEGMTWERFLDSEYNVKNWTKEVDSFSINGYSIVPSDVSSDLGSYYLRYDDLKEVDPSEKIEDGMVLTWARLRTDCPTKNVVASIFIL